MTRYEDILKYRSNKLYKFYVDYIRSPYRRFYRRYIQRYHMLDYRDLPNGYNGGYTDPVNQVLLANFAILKNFVQKERPFSGLMHKENKFYIHSTGEEAEPYYQEIWELYEWWTRGRFDDEKEVDKLASQVTYSFESTDEHAEKYGKLYRMHAAGPYRELYKLQDDLEKKEDEMLNRLMAVRRYLWT